MARFRTRARAVDMLGRQQIAGIPTAISELFKNAHDAYADRAVVDFFRSDGLFVLRDDGLGMTREDFERRWLTLGTESKLAAAGIAPPPRRDDRPKRPIMGEKGIGRLAIAAIGPQVLALTRAERDGRLGDLVCCFINWGLFELPGVDLEDVDLPVIDLPGGTLPTAADVKALTAAVDIDALAEEHALKGELPTRIRREIAAFDIDLAELIDAIGGPDLRTGPGTQFFIRPTAETLRRELADISNDETPDLLRTLVGFANTMTPGHDPPPLRTAFRDHYTEDAWVDLIEDREFFTPEEFESADHHFQGRFDEFGQFDGTVSIYGQPAVPYKVAWTETPGQPIRCGPFRVDVAYVQGRRNESRLDPEEWQRLAAKLNRFGGLYIYRDNVRVLPYGNTNFDFLDMERRRSISASDYFFSYRRIFGVVSITRAENGDLREKAGREGFAANEAYRQFRAILMNFFYKVAFDFFREAGARYEDYERRRTELQRIDRARARRNRQTRARQRAAQAELERFFDSLDADEPKTNVDALLARLEADISGALSLEDEDEAASALIRAEEAARRRLRDLIEQYDVRRPRGVGLTVALTRAFDAYDGAWARLREEVFTPAQAAVDAQVTDAIAEHRLTIDRRLRLSRAVENAVEHGRDESQIERRDLQSTAKATNERATALARSSSVALDTAIQEVLSEVARLDVGELDDKQFAAQRARLERRLTDTVESQSRALTSVTDQLQGIVWPRNGSGPLVTQLDEMEAVETELEALRQRAEDDLELTSVGLAINVVQHEFQASIRAVRAALRRLKSWSDRNPPLREPYNDLRTAFDHLDGYLTLFTPLQRRLYRTRVDVTGEQINVFLRDLFARRLEDSEVTVSATPAFLRHSLKTFPSTIYPVFVNLIDNAIFWLTGFRGSREIVLDVRDGAMTVTDTGPGVPPAQTTSVFDAGWTQKPGGSGLGLYISRQVLARDGMTLELEPPAADRGATFVIREKDDRDAA